jgi:drug/metabolite transporter (DMT)-like permease
MRDGAQATVALPQGSDLTVLLAMATGVSLLSFGPWMVRLAGVGGAASAFWRLSLAVLPLFILIGLTGDRARRLSPAFLIMVAAAGALYGLGMMAMNAAALKTSLANCGLIGNFNGFFVAGVALVAARRVPDASVSLCLLMSAAGLALVLGPSVNLSMSGWVGDLLALVAAMLFAGYFSILQRIPAGPKPLTVHGLATLTGAIVIAPVAFQDSLIPQNWWPIAALVFGQVVGQGLVVYAVPRLSGVVVGLCILIFPLQSMVIGWVFYGETMSLAQMCGAVLILGALVLLQARKAPA